MYTYRYTRMHNAHTCVLFMEDYDVLGAVSSHTVADSALTSYGG